MALFTRKQNMAEDVASRASDAARSVRSSAGSAVQTLANDASEAAANASRRLKSVGVDTDVMMHAAAERSSQLQTMIHDQVRRRPFRTLGVAAMLGALVGLLTTR